MSARFRSIKSNILSNKNTKIFAKTVTSNFMKSIEKSAKTNKDFGVTKSTRFSDNNLDTTIIASSIRTISKFKTRKKGRPLFINLEDFHKQFLLNKNKDNDTIASLYTQNGYNTICSSIKSKYLTKNHPKNNVIRLTKKSASPSFHYSSGRNSRNIFFNKNKFNKRNNKSNSIFSSFFENKNKNSNIFYLKEISKISKLKKSKNITNTNSNNFSNENNIFSNFLISSQKLKDFEPIQKVRKTLKKENNNLLTIDPELLNKIGNNFNQNENQQKKIGNLFHYLGRNNITINDHLAYPSFNSYLFARAKRFENIEQFLYKTRLLVLDKYIKNVNKNSYIKQLAMNENIFEMQALNQRSLEIMKKLFFSYRKTMDAYLRFLNRKFREMKEENEKLIQNIMKIDNDNEIIRQKIIRGMTDIREGFAIKFFLMCVKNHTLSIENFDKEDIEVIKNDKLKLNESYYYLKNPKNKKKNNKNSKVNLLVFSSKPKKKSNKSLKSLQFKNTSFSEDNNDKLDCNNSSTFDVEQKERTEYRIFDSIDEFFAKYDSIVTRIYILIKESIDKAANNVYLKMQLENLIKNNEAQIKEKIFIDSKIELYKQNLKDLKIKNKQLSNKLDSLMDNKFKDDIKIILVLKNIQKIYNNIRKKYDIQLIKKEDIIIFGQQIYLKIIEEFFLNILDKVKQDKINYPEKYGLLKLRIEKRKKANAFILFQKLLAQKIQIKIDAVLKRASKVIYKRYRKTNDYKQYYRNIDLNKEMESNKTTIELFFEYLNVTD